MFAARFDRFLWRIPRSIPAHKQTRAVGASNGWLRVRDSGGGKEALVFLCDPPIMVESYDKLIECFQPRYRVIVIELPNFGFSRTASSSALTFDGAVREIEVAIGALDLDACVLFGPCICGFVAAELAARAQLPIRGLILMQTPDREGMLSWVERMDPKGRLRIPVLGQLVVRFTARRIARFWLKYATPKEFDSDCLQYATDHALVQGGAYPLATMLQLWPKGLRNVNLKLPALAVWGRQDRTHKETAPASTCKHIPNADVIEFEDCGHFTELEKPHQFATSTMPFIESCFGGASA